MYESGGDENTGTEVLAEEEERRGNLHPLDLLGDHGETATTNTGEEDNDCAS